MVMTTDQLLWRQKTYFRGVLQNKTNVSDITMGSSNNLLELVSMNMLDGVLITQTVQIIV